MPSYSRMRSMTIRRLSWRRSMSAFTRVDLPLPVAPMAMRMFAFFCALAVPVGAPECAGLDRLPDTFRPRVLLRFAAARRLARGGRALGRILAHLHGEHRGHQQPGASHDDAHLGPHTVRGPLAVGGQAVPR